MRPEEFTSFEKQEPEKNKHLIVTNNLTAKNAHGEMSHVWLTALFSINKTETGIIFGDGIVTFDDANRRIIGLTHWKYA